MEGVFEAVFGSAVGGGLGEMFEGVCGGRFGG